MPPQRKRHLCKELNKMGAQISGIQESLAYTNFHPIQIQNQLRDVKLYVSLSWQEEHDTLKSVLKAGLMKTLLTNV